MVALTYGSAKGIALIIIVVLVAFALLTAKIASSFSHKALTLLIFGALVFGVWTQRQSLQSCADDVREIPGGRVATCSFFGEEIKITSPNAD